MRLSFDPAALLNRLRSTYWFVPSLMTAGAIALAVGLIAIDEANPETAQWFGWAYGGGAEGARSLLTAVAGSTITVVSVTFSVMVVALTVSSQHFGPRLLSNFMRDTAAQLVLGTFTGTYVYCLVVLRAVQGDGGDRYERFVPHLAVTTAVLITLLSVGMLIWYVHHVATSMQVSEITAGVVREFERTIVRMHPDPIGEGVEPPVEEPPPAPADAWRVACRRSGYLQEIANEAMLGVATDAKVTVWLLVRPGDFVVEGMPIAAVHPRPPDEPAREELATKLERTLVLGADRTAYQDAAFAVQQLVEVALRALSPGVNEPFTAITCVERLGQGLARLLRRRIPSAVRVDDDGNARVVAKPRTFAELAGGAFEPIAIYAGRNPAIGKVLFTSLRMLGSVAQRPDDRAALAHVADHVWTAVSRQLDEGRKRSELAALHESLQRELAGGGPP